MTWTSTLFTRSKFPYPEGRYRTLGQCPVYRPAAQSTIFSLLSCSTAVQFFHIWVSPHTAAYHLLVIECFSSFLILSSKAVNIFPEFWMISNQFKLVQLSSSWFPMSKKKVEKDLCKKISV